MDVRRLSRVVGDRWVVVVIAALVGLVGAGVFLWSSGPRAEPLFEATAIIRFDPAEGQTIPDLVEEVRAAREFAFIAAEDLLAGDPTARIDTDLAQAKLLFIALGPTDAQARAKADAMRESYLSVDPELGAGVEAQLEALRAEAELLEAQIAELQPALTPEQVALASQQTQLDTMITTLEGTELQLTLSQALAATADERATIGAQMGRLETTLAELRQERAALGPVPEPEQSAEDQLLLSTLEARKAQLATEFQRLYFRQLGVGGLETRELTQVVDISSDPLDPVLIAVAGFLGGALLAVAGLLMVARTRKTVWLPEDVIVPVLGTVPSRPVDASANEAWYDTAEPGPRRTAVQALRAAVLAQSHGERPAIAIAGHNTRAVDVQALAADVAGSLASAGDSVLLVDANFDSRASLGEYRVGGTSLADILRLTADAPDFEMSVDNAVSQAHVVRSGLAVIPSGPPPGSPADALAGRQYRSLIAAAAKHYDVTILVVDDFGTPSSQVAMQRLRHGIVVTTPGSTTESEINGLLAEAERLRTPIDGVVFVTKRGRISGLFRAREEEPAPRPKEKPAGTPGPERVEPTSPMTRLHNYSIPDERRSALVQHSPLGDLANSFGLSSGGEEAEGLGGELLSAIGGTSPDRAYEAVADYVVSRAEDMVTARYGYGDLLESLIHDVSSYGFLSLRPIRNHRTVGSWLTEEIESEVEAYSGAEVVKKVEALLSGDAPDVGIDGWLDREFFARHLHRTDGEPEVWHLASRERAVSLLVPARRLTVAKFEVLLTEVVSNTIDEIERKRKAAVTRADLEAAAEFEQQVWDVRTFDRSLREVLYGTPRDTKRGRSVAWEPDWSRGTRANLAAFQRHGLLSFEVLSDEELTALVAAV